LKTGKRWLGWKKKCAISRIREIINRVKDRGKERLQKKRNNQLVDKLKI